MLRPIVVGLNGSPESFAAADWGAREALRRHLPLHLVRAWAMPPQLAAGAQDPEIRKYSWQRVLREAEADLEARYPEVAVSAEQVPQSAEEALLDRSETSEMLVLGSRGHSALGGFLLGSVGQHVLARSTSPVVMVRQGTGAETERVGDEVVAGIHDPGKSGNPLIEFAFAAAASREARLRAVRAWRPPPVLAHRRESLRLADEEGGYEAHERKVLAEALHPWRERFPDVPVIEHVEVGNPSEVLLSAASRAGLLVVGRRTHRLAIGPRLGHVAHAALHHAACPVAVVPHD